MPAVKVLHAGISTIVSYLWMDANDQVVFLKHERPNILLYCLHTIIAVDVNGFFNLLKNLCKSIMFIFENQLERGCVLHIDAAPSQEERQSCSSMTNSSLSGQTSPSQ